MERREEIILKEREKIEEGRILKQRLMKENAGLDAFKEKSLKLLNLLNVEDKYKTDLQRFKPK